MSDLFLGLFYYVGEAQIPPQSPLTVIMQDYPSAVCLFSLSSDGVLVLNLLDLSRRERRYIRWRLWTGKSEAGAIVSFSNVTSSVPYHQVPDPPFPIAANSSQTTRPLRLLEAQVELEHSVSIDNCNASTNSSVPFSSSIGSGFGLGSEDANTIEERRPGHRQSTVGYTRLILWPDIIKPRSFVQSRQSTAGADGLLLHDCPVELSDDGTQSILTNATVNSFREQIEFRLEHFIF
ncbi:hypothetical protein OIO90_002647 [Microbotryomycetes sp. JL221]|nr:hypothetical protein OIO90_002647 [Microbotryomycetes sp. JL221]